MSTVSSPSGHGPAHNTANSSATSQARGSGKAGAQGPNGKADASGQNLFANLLQLLSATPDAAGLSLGADEPAPGSDAAATDALLTGTDALANGLLPGWLPQPQNTPSTGPGPAAGALASGGSAGGDLRPGGHASANPMNPTLAQGPTAEGGLSIAGMTPVAPGETLPGSLGSPSTATPEAAPAGADPSQLALNTEPAPTGSATARPALGQSAPAQWRATVTSTASLQRQGLPGGSSSGTGFPLGTPEAPSLRATAELVGQHPMALRAGMGWEARAAGNDPTTQSGTSGVGSTSTTGQAQASAAAGGSVGGGTGGQDGQALAEGPAADTHGLSSTDTEDAQALAYAAEAEEASAAPWGAGSLQQASLRVGDAQDAIDIQLALNGQALHVDFRTDDAQARESLQQHASESLSELLQRSGIELADVSVGAHTQQHPPGQQSGQDSAAQRSAQAASAAQRSASAGVSGSNAAPAPRRARTEGGLDLFV